MGGHVDAEAVKHNALRLQTHALFETVFAGQEYFAVGTDDAVPWESGGGGVKRPRNLAGRTGIPRGIGDVAVGGDFTARNTANLRQDGGEHGAGHDVKIQHGRRKFSVEGEASALQP